MTEITHPISESDIMGHRYAYVAIEGCPMPLLCEASYSPADGVTECVCGKIGWLGMDGLFYNQPEHMNQADKTFFEEREAALAV